MSLEQLLVDAVAAALRAHPPLADEVTSVFDAPPVRAARPYAVVEEPLLTDWSTKDMAGREARLAVMLRDDGERPVRLRALADAARTAVEGLNRAPGEGWRLASLVFLRARTAREGRDGGWVATLEFRARLLRIN